MKRSILILSAVFFFFTASAQTESAPLKQVANRFQRFYNDGKYDSVFYMFSAEMQKALPPAQTKAFLDGLKQQAGQLKTMAFQKKAGSVYSTYVSQFDKALLAVDFALDNDNRVAGFSVHNYNPSTAAKPARNRSKLSFPLKGSWTITWGGDTKEQNYHVESEAQKNAFDILITDQAGKTYRNSGKSNEDFYAFGKEISAPCDGEIVLAVNGVKDNIPGELNSFDVGGNTVILKTANNEYLVFCHLKHASMLVKEGQKITKGQLLGLVGNSGHSSEAHLHFHIQNQEQMNNATGIKCYFDKIVVDGKVKQDYSPVQNEKVSL